MPKRSDYVPFIQGLLAPHLVDVDSVWKGLYELLLWYEYGVPHIIDADKLTQGTWRSRALSVEAELSKEFGTSQHLPARFDQLIRSSMFPKPPQRQNPLGIGFVIGLYEALTHFAGPSYKFFDEGAIGSVVFPGVKQASRSKPDLVATKDGAEFALISAKWSLRHDRIKDVFDECDYFTTIQNDLQFYVITNEFDPARLDKLLGNRCIDGVFHVKKSLLTAAGLNGRLARVRDLSELLKLFH